MIDNANAENSQLKTLFRLFKYNFGLLSTILAICERKTLLSWSLDSETFVVICGYFQMFSVIFQRKLANSL